MAWRRFTIALLYAFLLQAANASGEGRGSVALVGGVAQYVSMFMKRRAGRVVYLGLVLAAGWSLPATAQEIAVTRGDRVRVTLAGGAVAESEGVFDDACRLDGTVLRIARDTLAIAVEPYRDPHSLPTPVRLEVLRRKGPGWEIPTVVGGVVVSVGTYAWLHSGGSTSRCDRSRNQDAMSSGECAALTFLGGAVGAGLGALTAGLLRTERWIPVPLGRVTLTVNPRLR